MNLDMRKRSKTYLALAVACLMTLATGLLACSHVPDKDDLAANEAALAAEREKLARAEPPLEVTNELIPPIHLGLGDADPISEPRFDVTVDRAPARQFFMSLVEGTPYSLALAPGVEGEISVALRDVTVEEVLDTLQQAYGFGYERTRTGFLVLPAGLQTEVFRLDYLNLHRSGSSQTRVSAGQISDQAGAANQIAGALGNNNANNRGQGNGNDNGFGGETSGSQVSTSSDTDLWTEIVDSVRTIVGTGDGRSVLGSPNAGLLVVRALPAELVAVSEYLRKAETSLNRVVILEAKILEVSLNDGFQSGINWALLASHNGDRGVVGQTGGGSVQDTGFSDSRGSSQNLGPPLEDLFASTAGSAFGGVFSLAIQAGKFSAFIELLETQGSVRTLSNPRISTVNNQKAVIKVGSDEFFVTDVSTTTVTGTATTSSPNVTLTPFFSGIALDVTPQISDEDEVILHVHPSVTDVVDQTKSFTVGGEPLELPLALSSIRESDSIVRAMSGQIVVIGGLIQTNDNDTTYGIPWLGRIPFLGRLFEHSLVENSRTELVILLRPQVVEGDGWRDELQETSSRLGEAWNEHRETRDEELRLDGWLPATPPVSR